MKKFAAILTASCLVMVYAAMATSRQDSSKETRTGWVMDEKCGAKMANEKGAACAKRCVQNGQPVVFVDDKDQSVLKVSNQDALKSHAGEHVSVSGSVENGALHVDNVSAASSK